MLHIVEDIKKSIKSNSNGIIYLYQSDFDHGTYRITKPGIYKLKDDIVFDPNPEDDWFPTEDQLKNDYSSSAFFLGFFAAITVESSNVCINLNGHKISQSPMHALKQRFFQTIELNNSPFIMNQGPSGTFANSGFIASQNIYIKNGFIGLTSHYSIHGNNNTNVYIKNVKMCDFETGGIALNQATNLVIKKCDISNSRLDTPVTAFFSVLRFILKVCSKEVMTKYTDFSFRNLSFEKILHRLTKLEKIVTENYINSNFKTVLSKNAKDPYNLEIKEYIHNKSGINDGSSIVGIQIGPKGVAIDGFHETICPASHIGNCTDGSHSKNIYILRTTIYNINSNLDEIISCKDGDKNIMGVMGEIPDFEKFVDDNEYYRPTIINDAQFWFGKLSNNYNPKELPICTSSVPQYLIDWAENKTKLTKAIKGHHFKLKFGFDIMSHTNKGIMALRLGGIDNLFLSRIQIHTINNYSPLPKFETSNLPNKYKYVKSKTNIEEETGYEYVGNFSFGVMFSSCSQITVNKVKVSRCYSKTGQVYNWFYNATDRDKIQYN